ncbi:putative MFS family arabinose efflux permease [Palleronia aestuarii]|uniref:Putative MFS family arabinose efflux permease n=1 Tax=Palleronia aestuarii TaxID=568105 RepID=A0A2W7NIR2_9RHOB|nr:MFS transporter [Palleronia aestuarii]PZX19760.1 putative MFS family arabinose efflux permease [Palleronia aestuarii]
MSQSSTRPMSAAWMPFAACCFAFFVVMAGATVPTPLYPIYSETYGFSPLTITAIFSIYSVGVIGTLLGTGPWSDQIGRKPILIGGLVAAALGSLAFLFAQGLPLLLVARFLQGASVGLYTAAATLAVSEAAPNGHDRIGGIGATAANMGGLGMGSILGGLILHILPDPLRSPYLVHLALVAAACVLLYAIPEPGERKAEPKLHAQGLSVPPEVRAIFVPAAISAFSSFMICGFMGAITPAFLGKVLGYEGWHLLIGTIAGLIFLASIGGQIAEETLPEAKVLPIGMGILTIGIVAITVGIAVQSLGLFVASIALTGIGHGIAFRGGLSALSEQAPAEDKAAVTATYFTVAYVAISIPVLVVGALQGPLGLPMTATGYGIVSAILSAVSFVLILRRQ